LVSPPGSSDGKIHLVGRTIPLERRFFAPLKPENQWLLGMTKEKLIEGLQKQFEDEFTGITFA